MQRYFSNIKKNDQLILNEEDMHHIKNVMRFIPDDLIEVVYEGEVYICSLGINNTAYIKHKIDNNSSNLKITLIVPLLQEQKMSLIFQKATELGVSKIIPVNMSRSVVKLDNDKFLKKQIRWQKICKEASEQSKRNDIPTVSDLKNIKDLKLEGLSLVCSTSDIAGNVKNCLKNNNNYDKINIVIGPEGGLTNEEEKELINIGFTPISLGQRILRVETVPMVILSIINYEYME